MGDLKTERPAGLCGCRNHAGDLANRASGGNNLSRVLPSSGADIAPEIAPDGKRIAFASDRARGWRVWVSGSDGANAFDVAGAYGLYQGQARWSPDGGQIVFECRNESNDDICAVPSGGGVTRRLTRHPATDRFPSWSRDGRWIYFSSDRSGSLQVLEGSGGWN